ncbi:MAG TPA: ECF-type sigma factor [Pyrinomonadaceae bacterium]
MCLLNGSSEESDGGVAVFTGLSIEETAEVMGVSARTVIRQWQNAKAWLHREISRGEKL